METVGVRVRDRSYVIAYVQLLLQSFSAAANNQFAGCARSPYAPTVDDEYKGKAIPVTGHEGP
jgi:hypothetical protein